MASTQKKLDRAAYLEAENRARKAALVGDLLKLRRQALRNMKERNARDRSRRVRGLSGGVGSGRVAPTSRYDAATRTRLRPGPRAAGGSAQKHLSTGSAHGNLRRDCQDLGRNSLAARALVKRAQQAAVGDGAVVTSTTDNAAWNEACDKLFSRWADGLEDTPEGVGHPDIRRRSTLWGLFRQVVKAWLTDGDILCILTRGGSIQLIESERIVSPMGAPLTDTMADGVELSEAGAPIAYHVGSWDKTQSNVKWTTERVSAANAYLLVNPDDDTVGLTRGEPGLQAAITRIEGLDNYIDKTGLAAEIATLFGILIKSEHPGETQSILEAGTDDQPTLDNTNSPREIDLEPALAKFLKPGESVEQVKPEYPTTNFKDYVMCSLMLIGADIGCPVVWSHLDASGMSWSNIKALLAMAMAGVRVRQESLTLLLRRIRSWKVQEWMRSGELDSIDDYDKCEVLLPDAPVVDFKSEVEGFANAVTQNLMTKDQATQKLGTGRARDVIARRAVEVALERKLGVAPPQMPGAKATEAKQEVEPAKPDGTDGTDGTDATSRLARST